METHTGKCLCGEVTYEVSGDPVLQGNCHCIGCRKNTGAGFATILFFKEEQVEQLRGKTSSFQYKSDSGNSKTKLFCQRCGSVVLGKIQAVPGSCQCMWALSMMPVLSRLSSMSILQGHCRL